MSEADVDEEPIRPEQLRAAYGAFLRPDRVLLTGHSHQAWPDVAREAMARAFDEAAELVDDKWGRAMQAADAVRAAVTERIGGRPEDVALASSSHELVSRWLSALPLSRRPHLVTTDGEFHSAWRQLRRLSEEGVEVTFVPPAPLETLAERLAASVRPDTAGLLASTVLFETGAVVPGLAEAARAAQRAGAEVLLDAYHAFNVVPFRVEGFPDPVFVTGGGYKYAQWGEGCCFLRVPPGCALRPVYTGWFADFAGLAERRGDGPVGYGPRGADRFAGSTYDPTSHYRARAVAAFFRERGLTVPRLRALSLRQTARIRAGLEGYDVATPAPEAQRGGFVAVRVANPGETVQALRERGVYIDARGDLARLGPAPYVTDGDIDRGLAAFREVARPA